MKTITQVVLPIAAVIGLVGFITFISNYTKSDSKQTLPSVEGAPLVFRHILAAPGVEGLEYWRAVYERGEKGHFDYWFSNPHPEEVTISATGTSCFCTGAELGLINKKAWNDHLQGSAIQGCLGFPGGALFGVANAIQLNSAITFQPLTNAPQMKHLEKPRFQVPAADPRDGPALGIVRMHWSPTGSEEKRKFETYLLSQLPNKTAFKTTLTAQFAVVPALHIFVPQTESADVQLGTILPGQSGTVEFICWSATRSEMDLSITSENLGDAAACVEWSKPVPMTDQQRQELAMRFGTKAPAFIRSAYRATVTAHERRTIEKDGKKSEHQLDLGPLDFRLVIADKEDPNPIKVPVSAVVSGDIRLSGIAVNNFRISLSTFDADVDSVTKVSVDSDRPGLDVELLDKETQPAYLKVEFTPKGENDGRKEWELKVTIPANSVIGPLPRASYVVLRTKDALQRRIRIPIRGTGVGSGGVPRL